MIIFKKIRYKNFLSTGNQFTEINFQKNNTNLIVGSNGAGKSTVLDALTFALFNKAFRKVNKNQLINTINEKECLVEIEFSINAREYIVSRGIKPNIFDIVVDGEKLNRESDDRLMQKVLEENIIKLNYKSFTQIVILGSSTFVPFMQLSSANRREVIEDLLDIRVFSNMNVLVKERIRDEKNIIKTLKLKEELLTDKISMQKNFIEEIESRGKENIEEKNNKIKELDLSVAKLIHDNEFYEDEIVGYTKMQEKSIGATETLKKFIQLKGKISNKVSRIAKEHEFFSQNTACPTCTQDIEEEFRINKIEDAQNKKHELQSGYKELEKTIQKEEERERHFTTLSKEITTLTHGISKNNTRISGCQRQIRDLESEIQTITDQLANRNTEHDHLANFKNNLKTTYDELASKKDTINYHVFAYGLLKDGGVKSKIIKKYLPLINQQVNRYLQMMDFYINFTLDEEFNETVQSPIHEDFSYASFSEGEKMRIDLSLLFTWREVARFKNSVNTNLLIMDEVFDSSLDGFGTEEFLKIIRFVIKDANIFVISHKTGMDDKFENCIKFEKIKGFSRMMS